MVNFDFLGKGLGIVPPPHFVYDFSRKKCFSHYILLTDQISLPDFLSFTSGFDVINFEINLTFQIRLIFYMAQKSKQKFKYLENEKSFRGEIKSINIFHIF